jgi:hypothetical protein
MPIVLNIDAIAAGDRAEVWHDSCAQTFVGVDVRAVLEEPIGGSVRAYDLGDLVVGEIDATGQGMARTQQLIDRADEQYLLLTLQTRGTGRVAQGDRRTLLRPGECAIFESHRPFELNFDAPFDVWVFGFPRHLVRLAEHERRQLEAQSVNCRTGLAGVASRALQDLALHSEELAGEPPGSVLSMANDLVVTLFAAQVSRSLIMLDDAESECSHHEAPGERQRDQHRRPVPACEALVALLTDALSAAPTHLES